MDTVSRVFTTRSVYRGRREFCRARRGHVFHVKRHCANGGHARKHGLAALDNVPLVLITCVMGDAALGQVVLLGGR